MSKKSVKEQFGANTAAYVTSTVHAKGASLARLVELLQPQSDWQVLDVATAAGHTAFAFAPHVAHVTATDITPEMITAASQLAQERGIDNVTIEIADAEALPYADGRFHLVTCRIAPHHFADINQFLSQSVRVLRPGGLLAVVDNIVPEGTAGDYVNAFEKRRDPSHGRCLSLAEWQAAFRAAGLTVRHAEILVKAMDFAFWAQRHDEATQAHLHQLLLEAPDGAKAFLNPQTRDGRLIFHLQEGLLIGQTHTF